MTKRNFSLFRVLTSFIFIYAGTNHLLQPGKILGKVAKGWAYQLLDMPSAFSVSIGLSGVVMIVFGVLLSIGYKQRVAALVLLAVLIPITLMAQLDNLQDLGPFFKNVALTGSLIFIINYKAHEVQKPLVRSYGPAR
jgi:putative oxidoreductase